MGRKSTLDQPGFLLNPKVKALNKDLYEGLSEAEAMILDAIIANFMLREIMGVKDGDEATERQIAAITGLSKSGVRVVQDKAMKRVKSKLVKANMTKVSDWVNDDSARQFGKVRGQKNSD